MKFLLLGLAALLNYNYSIAQSNLAVKSQLHQMVLKASKENNIKLIQEYINHNGSLDIQNEKGYSPLIFAAYYGHEKMVKLLLKSGADSCLKDRRGNSALMGAIFKGHLSIAYELMNSRCDIDSRNKSNQTALMYASLFGREKLVRKLMDKGASPKALDLSGNNSIDLAKKQDNFTVVNILNKSD